MTKLLELRSEFRKTAGYKDNTQKIVCTSNEQVEIEVIKDSTIYNTKHEILKTFWYVQYPYAKNYKSGLKKQIKGDVTRHLMYL